MDDDLWCGADGADMRDIGLAVGGIDLVAKDERQVFDITPGITIDYVLKRSQPLHRHGV